MYIRIRCPRILLLLQFANFSVNRYYLGRNISSDDINLHNTECGFVTLSRIKKFYKIYLSKKRNLHPRNDIFSAGNTSISLKTIAAAACVGDIFLLGKCIKKTLYFSFFNPPLIIRYNRLNIFKTFLFIIDGAKRKCFFFFFEPRSETPFG